MENHLSALKVNNILNDFYIGKINLARCLNEFGCEIFFNPKEDLADLISPKDFAIYKIVSNFEYILNEPKLESWKNIWGYVEHLRTLTSVRNCSISSIFGAFRSYRYSSNIQKLVVYIDENQNYIGRVTCPFCNAQIKYISGEIREHTWCDHLLEIERVSNEVTEIPELQAFFKEDRQDESENFIQQYKHRNNHTFKSWAESMNQGSV